MKVKISACLSQDLKDSLDLFAGTRGISRSQVMGEALEEYLLRHTIQGLREALLPYAKAEAGLTDAEGYLLSSWPDWPAGPGNTVAATSGLKDRSPAASSGSGRQGSSGRRRRGQR